MSESPLTTGKSILHNTRLRIVFPNVFLSVTHSVLDIASRTPAHSLKLTPFTNPLVHTQPHAGASPRRHHALPLLWSWAALNVNFSTRGRATTSSVWGTALPRPRSPSCTPAPPTASASMCIVFLAAPGFFLYIRPCVGVSGPVLVPPQNWPLPIHLLSPAPPALASPFLVLSRVHFLFWVLHRRARLTRPTHTKQA